MRRILGLLLLAVIGTIGTIWTSGCYRPKPATVPLRTLALAGRPAGSPGTPCLVIFLPGRGDGPEEYLRNGFPEALRKAGSQCAMMGADAHLGYYNDRSIVQRLDEDVIGPAREHGIKEIWLVGISLGGLGSLLYTREHPGDVNGLVLLSPYLGEDDVVNEVKGAGGLAAWSPRQPPAEGDFRALWLFLKGFEKPDPALPPTWLGYGTKDRLREPDEMLAAVLLPSHVFTAEGGHKWSTWRKLWEQLLATGMVPGKAPGKPAV
jgi:pimeloyl-ACP methyl ester carboxylesterase